MKCPFCGFEDTKVVDSRPVDGKNAADANAQAAENASLPTNPLKCPCCWL